MTDDELGMDSFTFFFIFIPVAMGAFVLIGTWLIHYFTEELPYKRIYETAVAEKLVADAKERMRLRSKIKIDKLKRV